MTPLKLAPRPEQTGEKPDDERERLPDLSNKVVIYSSAEREFTESLCWCAERNQQAADD